MVKIEPLKMMSLEECKDVLRPPREYSEMEQEEKLRYWKQETPVRLDKANEVVWKSFSEDRFKRANLANERLNAIANQALDEYTKNDLRLLSSYFTEMPLFFKNYQEMVALLSIIFHELGPLLVDLFNLTADASRANEDKEKELIESRTSRKSLSDEMKYLRSLVSKGSIDISKISKDSFDELGNAKESNLQESLISKISKVENEKLANLGKVQPINLVTLAFPKDVLDILAKAQPCTKDELFELAKAQGIVRTRKTFDYYMRKFRDKIGQIYGIHKYVYVINSIPQDELNKLIKEREKDGQHNKKRNSKPDSNVDTGDGDGQESREEAEPEVEEAETETPDVAAQQ